MTRFAWSLVPSTSKVVSAIDKQGRVKLMREDKYLRQKEEDSKIEGSSEASSEE